jgi:outer membrane protein TolC
LRTENLRRARETLGEALGSAEAYGVTPAIRLDALVKDAQTSCVPERSIEARPDVRAAAQQVRVAERSVKAVDYSFLPTVDGVSSLTYWSHEDSSANAEHITWTIGGVLTWNLYDGGFRYGTRSVREADVALTKDRLTETRRRAQLEVTQSMRGVTVAGANLAVSARTREIAQQTARLTRIAYLNGTGTSFDLVDSARRLREAELDFAVKEFEVLRAKITALLALATCRV